MTWIRTVKNGELNYRLCCRPFGRSWAEQRVAVMQANLEGDIPDGIMMRVSVLSADAGRAEDQLQDFSRAFINAAPAPLRRVLLGTAT